MQTFLEWADDNGLLLEAALVKYLFPKQWGKSADDMGQKGFAIYGVPINPQTMKPAGSTIAVWAKDIRRATQEEGQFGNNFVLQVVPDPRFVRQAGNIHMLILGAERANQLLDEFESFQKQQAMAQAQSQVRRVPGSRGMFLGRTGTE
jgi:hypothetical protein